MPWKEKTVAMEREEFVKRVLSAEKSKSALCREYGISRPTADKWIGRYKQGETLSNRSRKPFKTANRTDSSIEEAVIAYRKEHPAIGAVKIHRMMTNEGKILPPSASTINAIFKRNGLITREASAAATPCKRFEKARPNEMWQADFKGHFAMQNGERCHPLNILDDNSRFNLCCDALLSEELDGVKKSVTRLFMTYGMPFSFLCDNGNPWGVSQSTGFSRFEVWLMELGILTLHGRIRHPQTQGKEESFNRSMTREWLKYNPINNIEHAQISFNEYRKFYNEKRPHHALNLDTPESRYVASEVRFPTRIEDWEYPVGYELRKIKESGYFTYGGQGYYLSEAFGNKTIAVRESSKPGCITLCFRQFIIGRIDIEKRVFTMKRAYLAENDPRLEPQQVD